MHAMCARNVSTQCEHERTSSHNSGSCTPISRILLAHSCSRANLAAPLSDHELRVWRVPVGLKHIDATGTDGGFGCAQCKGKWASTHMTVSL